MVAHKHAHLHIGRGFDHCSSFIIRSLCVTSPCVICNQGANALASQVHMYI